MNDISEHTKPCLFFFNRIAGPLPFFPSAHQDGDLGEPHFDQLPCHTGTGAFVFSGAVKNNPFVPGIILGP